MREAERFTPLRAWAVSLAVFLVLAAVGGELLLHFLGFGHPIVYRLDPQIGYFPAPHQDVHRYGGNIHINAFGMRSRDVSAEKPAGTFRILMLGDSTLYGGSYLDQSQIYSTRLEKLLNDPAMKLPGSPGTLEVLCMGVNAWGPQHELAYVSKFGIFQADLVMVMGPPNDAYRPLYGIERLPFYAEGHRPRFAWQEFWDHALWAYRMRQWGGDAATESRPSAGQTLSAGVASWLKIAALAQQQGSLVDFELLPSEAEARAGKADEAAQQVLNALLPEFVRRRIPFSFPLALFGDELGSLKLYYDGAHLSATGHTFYSMYLRDRVEQVVSDR